MSKKSHEVAIDDDLVGARNCTNPQAQTFLHAVHLRKVGRVARFWAAKGPLAPRKEGRKKGALEGRRLLRSTIHFHREAAFVSTLRAR